jgi:hypothetical protein
MVVRTEADGRAAVGIKTQQENKNKGAGGDVHARDQQLHRAWGVEEG